MSLVGEDIHRSAMSITRLECQVSNLANRDTCRRPTTGACAMTVSLLQSLEQSSPEFSDYDKLYPINSLRNLALEQATTPLVFSLDADFVPSRRL